MLGFFLGGFMRLRQLCIRHFRNIIKADLTGLADFNFIHGLNGSGKTSALEALHTLSVSHSFRSRKIKSVITEDQDALLVRGALSPNNQAVENGEDWLAVQRSRSRGTLVKYRQERLASVGDMAGLLPVQLINPDSFALIEGSPSVRRQFLDWSVFHVKHLDFYMFWQRYRKALQQRNSLLRRGKIDKALLAAWDNEIAVVGEKIALQRQQQFNDLAVRFESVYSRLGGIEPSEKDYPAFNMRFNAGWDNSQISLLDSLASSFEGDLRQGFTRHGPHRADIDFRVNGRPAAELLSRGQIKTVVCALKIAQSQLLEAAGVTGIMLIDDLPAELDANRRAALFAELRNMQSQVYATSIESSELDSSWCGGKTLKRFHVERGNFF